MRRRTLFLRSVLSGGVALACLAQAPRVWAQADTNPPLPNAMLLIDSSGSMEYMMGLDKTGKPTLPKCANGDPNGVNEQNRWATLATVLTGEIPQFACVAQSRSDPAFVGEYSINGKSPYDKDYYLPYNRMVSYNSAGAEACVLGPDTTKWPGGGGAYSFAPDAIRSHKFNSQTACAPIGGATGALLQVERRPARRLRQQGALSA